MGVLSLIRFSRSEGPLHELTRSLETFVVNEELDKRFSRPGLDSPKATASAATAVTLLGAVECLAVEPILVEGEDAVVFFRRDEGFEDGRVRRIIESDERKLGHADR